MGKCGTTESRGKKSNIRKLMSYQVSPLPLIIFNGNIESEITTNTSHYLGDDQRDTTSWTFKHAALHAALMMLKGS